MSWTKGDIVREAYAEIALAGWVYDLDPEEIATALRRLDTLMATWQSQGLRLGYNLNADPLGSDEADASGLPLEAVEAVYMALAVRIAAGKGKALSGSTKSTAKAAYDALVSRQAGADIQQQQFRSGSPRGAGNKPWRNPNRPYLPTPTTKPLQDAADDGLTFAGTGN